MARNQGRHRIARRTKIATALLGLSIAVGALVVSTTTGDPERAAADEVDRSQFVDITKVRPNVEKPEPGRNASTGSFTVDCGRNENGHFNPDNFIAQPGVRNGAQHLHDYVGNLSTNADSDNDSLLGAGTTCRNGDESTYFWPVVRIDTAEEAAEQQGGQNQERRQDGRDQNRDGDRTGSGTRTTRTSRTTRIRTTTSRIRLSWRSRTRTTNSPATTGRSSVPRSSTSPSRATPGRR